MVESIVPPRVEEYAARAVDYVRRAIGLTLEYDSDTLPLLDHYLRSVPPEEVATIELVALTAGVYFGEVVRRRIGGRWDILDPDATQWRVVLPTGLNFSPVGFATAAIIRADLDDLDSEFDAPPRMRPYVAQTLERMGEVSVDDYYSLCGRLDTLEHVHEVLVAVAARLLGDAPDGVAAADGDGGDPAEPVDPAGAAESVESADADERGDALN
jgi:hypothetical protein